VGVPHLTSVARIGGFAEQPPSYRPVDRSAWETGDFVLGEVLEGGSVPYAIENPVGRAVEVLPGDRLVGALGRRTATLQIVGDWTEVGDDLEMDTLTAGGVLGRATSAAVPRPPIARLHYAGHAHRDGRKLTMADCAGAGSDAELEAPVVLIIGTSMDSGKTVTGKAVVRSLVRLGQRVAAAKLTGVGRYRDVLAFGDAGAEWIRDFVDAGLPSTAVDPARYSKALGVLLSMLAEAPADAVVAEAGASPLEPYNGATAIELLGDRRACTILCASDPYAITGVIEAFGYEPDLVAGRATSTSAAIDLIGKLTGLPAVNALDPGSGPVLDEVLSSRLGLSRSS
jgi:hypothetical protein